jgi:hypothetical protein
MGIVGGLMEIKHGSDIALLVGGTGFFGGVAGAVIGAVTADEDSERFERGTWGFFLGALGVALLSGAVTL